MAQPELLIEEVLLQKCLNWFQEDFRQSIVSLIESQFPNYVLPSEVQSVLDRWEQIRQLIEGTQSTSIDVAHFFPDRLMRDAANARLLKQMILRYRRQRAAQTESLREKTFNDSIIQTLNKDICSLDTIVEADWFRNIEASRLPRSKDFLPVQYIDQSALGQMDLAPRQFDEKFHILQAPALFLLDLAYFRGKCEMRDSPVSVAFLDIDDFKSFNAAHNETMVDRNLLPRFMQILEAHVFHHGFAYRQGGDEYLMLLPSLSRELAISFLDELRCKLADSRYPEIEGTPTVSIGICLAEPDCPLTDRELRDRANEAKKFAKHNGKNCIATYDGGQLIPEVLRVVRGGK